MEILLNNPYLGGFAVLTLVNTVFFFIVLRRFSVYRKNQKLLLAGEDVGNLEDVILKNKKTLEVHAKNLKELGEILEELVDQNRENVQKVGIVRFNPFADTGANMSFSLALLDGDDNGIVISSLHGREGTRIYAKPIEKGISAFSLTDEEKEAIGKASSA